VRDAPCAQSRDQPARKNMLARQWYVRAQAKGAEPAWRDDLYDVTIGVSRVRVSVISRFLDGRRWPCA
jgi:hypothetical protein